MLWEKAIRFRHPAYQPDRAQKLISSSMSRHLWTRNISSKSTMHAFFSNLAYRQTDKRTRARGRKHIPPPLSQVNNSFTDVHVTLLLAKNIQPLNNLFLVLESALLYSYIVRNFHSNSLNFLGVLQENEIECLFYRATRMHSADCAVARCLSVCPSVRHTPVICQRR